MTCQEFEILLCEYVDGTLSDQRKAAIQEHLEVCPACSELARDVTGAVAFMERVADVDPPAELVTRILFETRSGAHARERKGAGRWLRHWLEPILQPRFAMGMAMTILSFSMIGRFAGISPSKLQLSDFSPARVWENVDNRIHGSWERVVKYYDSLRLVYEIQTRLKELTDEGEQNAPGAVGLTETQTKGRTGATAGTDQGSTKSASPGGANKGVPTK